MRQSWDNHETVYFSTPVADLADMFVLVCPLDVEWITLQQGGRMTMAFNLRQGPRQKINESYSTHNLGCDGTNSENESPKRGEVKEISKTLNRMWLTAFKFVLWDFMLVSTHLSFSEAWYNITERDMVQLEQVDKENCEIWLNWLGL